MDNNDKYISEEEIFKNMKDTFGFNGFMSSKQKDAVKAVLCGDENVIVSMPTNSGKSLCFQLPALLPNAETILVISPNLSLMENQMHYLNKIGLRAESINSKTAPGSPERRVIRESLMTCSDIKFFYLCPEMAAMDYYIYFINEMLDNGRFSHVVIDEAHCVIDIDYRPAFKLLKDFRFSHPKVPFIALTTASENDLIKIEEELGMVDSTLIRASSDKENTFYEAVFLKDDEEIDYMEFFTTLAPNFKSLKPMQMPTGIIFCSTFNKVEQTIETLQALDVPATCFHSGLVETERFDNYAEWMADKVPVMVATPQSFGLGILKQHVKFVIHADMPKDLRAYYQESGRAGVAGEKAISRVYYKRMDLARNKDMALFFMTKNCRHQMIAEIFEDTIRECGDRCDNCIKRTLLVKEPKQLPDD